MKFGRTWWGQLWLNAFLGIDYGNRLPRGRTYARHDRVSEMVISNDGVKAKVKGSRRSPYRVRVALAPFPKRQQQQIYAAINQNPLILGQLVNRTLPEQIYELTQDIGIALLPESWRSMNARCSCPDWAVPCKHIAAVIYLLANEIDRNPFVIFQLHNMDLVEGLAKESKIQFREIADPPQFPPESYTEPCAPEHDEGGGDLLETDLSVIPDIGDRVFDLLSSDPLFHPRDYKKTLSVQYKRIARLANQYEKEIATSPDDSLDVLEFVENRLMIGPIGEFLYAFNALESVSEYSIDVWIRNLAHLKPNRDQPANLEEWRAMFWFMIFRLAMKLLSQRAFVPAVYGKQGQTLIQWRPALLDESIISVLNRFYVSCPADLVLCQDSFEGESDSKNRYLSRKHQVDCALNVILKHFTEKAYMKSSINDRQDDVNRLFLTTGSGEFFRDEDQDMPKAIHHWLNLLHLRERNHRILLIVDLDQESYESDDHQVITEAAVVVQVRIESGMEIFSIQEFAAGYRTLDDYANILSDLTLLAEFFPDIESLVQQAPSGEIIGIRYSLAEFTPLLLEHLPTLEMLGVQLVLPKSLRHLVRPQISLASTTTSKKAKSYLQLKDLVSFNWQVALGSERISVDEFMRLLDRASGLVLLKDQFVLIDSNEMKSMLNRLNRLPDKLTSQQLLTAHLTGELDGAQLELGDAVAQFIDGMLRIDPEPIPKQLRANLRPYQIKGYEWLVQNAKIGFGSLLADDMGLGKTLQVIALLLRQKESGELAKMRALVVVPTSLLTNWRKEIENFAPTLSVRTYHGANREYSDVVEDVVLTSFGVVRSDIDNLRKHRFQTLVVDEAQNIKNPSSQQTRAVKLLKAKVRIGLSGTPVENRLMDYWSIMDFCVRGLLGPQAKFQKTIASPIEKERNSACLSKFRKLTSPFILRRLKNDKSIISDLPDKIVSDRFCTLTEEQAALYEKTVDNVMKILKSSHDGIERRGIVFSLINSLKQICNAPSHFLRRNIAQPNESGKLRLLTEIMREPLEVGDKVLIFTQFARMGEILVKSLQSEFGVQIPFFHGGLSRTKRDRMVELFQSDNRTRAMVISLKAGGTGLNLTAASQLVHYDLWWNPAVENQATDRAYRIGQTKNVMVHRLITENTFEERINKMIQGKTKLANLTVAAGERSITELSNEELRELVALS